VAWRKPGAAAVSHASALFAAIAVIVILSAAVLLWRATQIDPIETLHET
jgi:ABC-type antimicrobial peptide transport system permease subunit